MKNKQEEKVDSHFDKRQDLHQSKELKTDWPLSEKDEVKKAEAKGTKLLRKRHLL